MRVDVSGSRSHQCLLRVHARADVQMVLMDGYPHVFDAMNMPIVNVGVTVKATKHARTYINLMFQIHSHVTQMS